MSIYTLTREDFITELNKGKEIYLDKLFKEGVIDEDKYNEMLKYSIILTKKTMLGSIWDKLYSDKNKNRYDIVKVLNTIEEVNE